MVGKLATYPDVTPAIGINSIVTLGLCAELQRLGIEVPRDISSVKVGLLSAKRRLSCSACHAMSFLAVKRQNQNRQEVIDVPQNNTSYKLAMRHEPREIYPKRFKPLY
jgi:hypothetical protein